MESKLSFRSLALSLQKIIMSWRRRAAVMAAAGFAGNAAGRKRWGNK